MRRSSVLLGIVCLFSVPTAAQYIHHIKADSVHIHNESCRAELILENSTRTQNGAFLQNRWNGRTQFAYAIDSSWVSGDSLYLHRGDQTFAYKLASGSSAAVNGLTAYGDGIGLGGTLTKDAIIHTATYPNAGYTFEIAARQPDPWHSVRFRNVRDEGRFEITVPNGNGNYLGNKPMLQIKATESNGNPVNNTTWGLDIIAKSDAYGRSTAGSFYASYNGLNTGAPPPGYNAWSAYAVKAIAEATGELPYNNTKIVGLYTKATGNTTLNNIEAYSIYSDGGRNFFKDEIYANKGLTVWNLGVTDYAWSNPYNNFMLSIGSTWLAVGSKIGASNTFHWRYYNESQDNNGAVYISARANGGTAAGAPIYHLAVENNGVDWATGRSLVQIHNTTWRMAGEAWGTHATLEHDGRLKLNVIDQSASDPDRILVSDGGVVKYMTKSQLGIGSTLSAANTELLYGTGSGVSSSSGLTYNNGILSLGTPSSSTTNTIFNAYGSAIFNYHNGGHVKITAWADPEIELSATTAYNPSISFKFIEGPVGKIVGYYNMKYSAAPNRGHYFYTNGANYYGADFAMGLAPDNSVQVPNKMAIGTTTFAGSEKLRVDGTILSQRLTLTGLPTFADDAAAGAGGLTAGQLYKTATGVLMVKL